MDDILIIGSGPAGYTAAIYAARAGRSTKIITGPQPGGQLIKMSLLENYSGFSDPISGLALMDQMKQQAEKMGVIIVSDIIKSVDFSKSPFRCTGELNTTYESKTLIIATGANAKWLGIPGEDKYLGAGVSACAVCDGFFFRNKNVAVVGGGNTAVEEAMYLTNFAQSVVLVHRGDKLRAEQIMQKRLEKNPKVEIMWNTRVVNIFGDGNKVTELLLTSTRNNMEIRKAIDGVFVAIGHQPATSIFEGQLEVDENGYIVTNKANSATSIPGIFAAGDVCNPNYRQAIVSAGQGCVAALDADRFLSGERQEYSQQCKEQNYLR
ncbi:MAG: thioredoxin-disulfide reductase [Holosporaceae bacterium]|jgi:thioredoxin reductase (NADPH)|nr:thioredoxin-disulfide reductase [Holosporaceae bacterium]